VSIIKIFNDIKSLEYDDAKNKLVNIENIELRSSLEKFIDVKENDGQNSSYEEIKTKIPNYRTSNYFITALHLLTKCQSEISYYKANSNTLKDLYKALEISERKSYKELNKLILISIFDLYRRDLVQKSNDYDEFLFKYKMLIESPEDASYYYINNLAFQGRKDTIIEEHYKLGIEKLDSIFILLDLKSKLRPLYLFEKGIFHSINEEYDKAKKFYEKTIDLTDGSSYYRYINFGAYLKLSQIASKKGDYAKALFLLNQTKNFKNNALPKDSDYYYNLYGFEYYENQLRIDSAYSLLKKVRVFEKDRDIAINNNLRTQTLIELQTAEKEKRIIKIRALAIILAGSLGLGSIIAFLVYRSTKRKQHIAEQEKELEIQKTTQILKEKEVETINAMVEGQEKERLRLAGELHDNLGSTLATVKMQVENLERNLEKVDDPKSLLSKTNTLINEAYQKVRRISHERHRLSNHLEITIFRIVQELTTNIVKHAQATEASISLTQHDNELNIIVEDNGKGFKVGKLETKNGMGLGSIERRVEHLEGTMEVDSIPGKGTSIIIDIPL